MLESSKKKSTHSSVEFPQMTERDAEDERERKTFLTVGMLKIREKINIFINMDGDNGKIRLKKKIYKLKKKIL